MINLSIENGHIIIEGLKANARPVSLSTGNWSNDKGYFEIFCSYGIIRYNIGLIENINGFSTDLELENFLRESFSSSSYWTMDVN